MRAVIFNLIFLAVIGFIAISVSSVQAASSSKRSERSRGGSRRTRGLKPKALVDKALSTNGPVPAGFDWYAPEGSSVDFTYLTHSKQDHKSLAIRGDAADNNEDTYMCFRSEDTFTIGDSMAVSLNFYAAAGVDDDDIGISLYTNNNNWFWDDTGNGRVAVHWWGDTVLTGQNESEDSDGFEHTGWLTLVLVNDADNGVLTGKVYMGRDANPYDEDISPINSVYFDFDDNWLPSGSVVRIGFCADSDSASEREYDTWIQMDNLRVWKDGKLDRTYSLHNPNEVSPKKLKPKGPTPNKKI